MQKQSSRSPSYASTGKRKASHEMNENLKQMQERINARQSLIDAREDQIADLVIKNETPKISKPTKEEALQMKDKV